MTKIKYLTLLLMLHILPAHSADPMEELDKEIQRQEQKHWQEQVSHVFMKLGEHFSPHEIEQMNAKQMGGIELSQLSDEQVIALHNLLSVSLSPLGYTRASTLLGFQKIQSEMGSHNGGGRLFINNSAEQKAMKLETPTFAITLQHNDTMWEIDSLYFGHSPHKVMPAPQPDLSKTEIHYPYIRWSEAVGTSPLGQTARLAVRVLNEIPDMKRKTACQGSADATALHCPLSSLVMEDMRGLVVNDLDTQERYLLRKLAMELNSHLPQRLSQSMSDAKLSWAGDIPSDGLDDSDKNLLIHLGSSSGNWQILITGSTVAEMENRLPANTLIIRYNRNGSFTQDFINTEPAMTKTMTDSMINMEAQPTSTMMNPVAVENRVPARSAGMTDENMKDKQSKPKSSEGYTWLKDPAFLNGMALSIGYEGTMVSFNKPFVPAVRVKKDGRIHKNIRVSVSMGVENEKFWLENLPLVFNPESQDYRANLHLPVFMEGKNLILRYSVHEPGTRYEGLYEYKVDTETGKAIPNTLF